MGQYQLNLAAALKHYNSSTTKAFPQLPASLYLFHHCRFLCCDINIDFCCHGLSLLNAKADVSEEEI